MRTYTAPLLTFVVVSCVATYRMAPQHGWFVAAMAGVTIGLGIAAVAMYLTVGFLDRE